jgi:hypothetical protein
LMNQSIYCSGLLEASDFLITSQCPERFTLFLSILNNQIAMQLKLSASVLALILGLSTIQVVAVPEFGV